MFSPKVRELLHVSSKDSEIIYLEHRLEKQKKGETFFFCIFENKSKKLIGAIEIRNPKETDSQLYSWLNEKYWGTGMYQEALGLLSKKYFNETNEKIYRAKVDISNLRSYKALKKHGFIDVGLKKGPQGKQYILVLTKNEEID
jgi:RimJ/RimL family protein N-acetyltransferase